MKRARYKFISAFLACGDLLGRWKLFVTCAGMFAVTSAAVPQAATSGVITRDQVIALHEAGRSVTGIARVLAQSCYFGPTDSSSVAYVNPEERGPLLRTIVEHRCRPLSATVSPNPIHLILGESIRVTAKFVGPNERPMPWIQPAFATSTNGVTVTSGGRVEAREEGTAQLYITGDTLSTRVQVVVEQPLRIGEEPLSRGKVAELYTEDLRITGAGPGPATVRVARGVLPQGLEMSSAGRVSGIPIVPGTYSFWVAVSRGRHESFAEVQVEIEDAVSPPPVLAPITIDPPAAIETASPTEPVKPPTESLQPTLIEFTADLRQAIGDQTVVREYGIGGDVDEFVRKSRGFKGAVVELVHWDVSRVEYAVKVKVAGSFGTETTRNWILRATPAWRNGRWQLDSLGIRVK